MSDQVWSPETYARNGAFVAALGGAVVDWLEPKAGERILDLGCGDGTLTQSLVAAGARVIGIDGAPAFVAAARAKGIDARLGDGEALTFEREFDAVFSNAALHWMLRPDEVIAGVARALVPGGRFAGELGGEGNVTAIFTALRETLARRGIDATTRSPWYFPSVRDYRRRLEAGGFTVERIELFPRPTPLPTGIGAWLETFAQPLFAGLAAAEARTIVAECEDLLAPKLREPDGTWIADYVRLRFRAVYDT